jgi:prepilin-type N-terminal cleavage/methylation domain-containing protein
MKTTLNKGFTLIEMSIVMLILALLTGGIFVGKDLIHSSEVRATITQVEMFNLAYNTFQLKYNCWPGDCNNASELGFSGDFTVQLSKNDELTPDGLLNYISPISSAYAFLSMSEQVPVNKDLKPSGITGQLIDPLTGITYPAGPTIVVLNGNNNCAIENVPADSQMEGPTGLHMLQEANMISGLDPSGRVYLKLSSAFATIGNANLPAFWVISDLAPGNDQNSYPSIIKDRGTYLQGIASFQPFAASSMPVKDAWAIDIKIDDGFPLTGVMRSSSTAQTNLLLGPTYDEGRDSGPKKCLITASTAAGGGIQPGPIPIKGVFGGGGNPASAATSNEEVMYNTNSTNAGAKCSQVIKLHIGGCTGS